MKNVISLYPVEKLVENKLAVYPKKTENLLTLRTKCIFNALSDICIHHEKKYIGRYQATQRYCVNPFNTHGIQISKVLRNLDEELALFLNIIPGQKLCKRCKETAKGNMKAAKNNCENNKDDLDSSYLTKDFNRSRFSSSAEALSFSPITMTYPEIFWEYCFQQGNPGQEPKRT